MDVDLKIFGSKRVAHLRQSGQQLSDLVIIYLLTSART